VSYQVGHDPIPEGADMSDAPLESPTPNAAKTDAAFGAMGLKSTAPPGAVKADTGNAAPVKDDGTRVTLVPVSPLGGLVLPPLEEGGETVTITVDGTEVSAADAERAHAVAMKNGFKLREL
jgi:hypothetical protein